MMLDKQSDNQVIIKQLNLLVKQFKIKLLLHTLINVFPWLAVLLVIGFYFKLSVPFLVITFFLVSLFAVFLRIRSARYQQVTLNKLLLTLATHKKY